MNILVNRQANFFHKFQKVLRIISYPKRMFSNDDTESFYEKFTKIF